VLAEALPVSPRAGVKVDQAGTIFIDIHRFVALTEPVIYLESNWIVEVTVRLIEVHDFVALTEPAMHLESNRASGAANISRRQPRNGGQAPAGRFDGRVLVAHTQMCLPASSKRQFGQFFA
jgi:hypothetical protein